MKRVLGTCLLALTVGANAQFNAAFFSQDIVNAPIPDGDQNGLQASQYLEGVPGLITDVNVTLNIFGGFNGDFYAYLYHNDTMAVLFNRVGRTATSSFGYSDPGFGPNANGLEFTLDDQAARDIHLYRTSPYTLNFGGQLTGLWQPDGRVLDPLSPGSAFDLASRPARLNLFNGTDANGLWLLFIADVSPGVEGRLVNWGLDITTVPEPSSMALLLGFLGTLWLFRARPNF
jgi:subtilisin-like proprotein convertase family protein